MKTFYVVWRMRDGSIKSDTVEIEGTVNHWTIEKAVRDKRLGYYERSDFDRLISWQEEERFTDEEHDEFWNNY